MNWERYWNHESRVRDPDPFRQVGRTVRGVRYSDEQLAATVGRLQSLLEPNPDQRLLDLACGNGLITSLLAPRFKNVVAVDYSRPLIESARGRFACANVDYVLGNATELDGLEGPFDAVLVSGGFQFFADSEAERFFSKIGRLIVKKGRIVLGDVADRDRIWNFYRGFAGRVRYSSEIVWRRPLIGHWWRPARLIALARRHGWLGEICYQSPDLPNHYFRYDALFRRVPLEHRDVR